MEKKILLDVVTPDGLAVHQDVDLIVAPGIEGDLGVMPGHLPLMTRLRTGVLRYYVGDEQSVLAISEGYLEVTPKKVIVLAEAAELPEEIDVQRALEAKRRAEERLSRTMTSQSDLARARASLRRAIVRLSVAESRKEERHKGRDQKQPD